MSSTIGRLEQREAAMAEVQSLPVAPEQPFGYQGLRLPLPTLLPPIRNPHGQQWHRSSPRLAALQPFPSTLPPARTSPVISLVDPYSPIYTARSPPAPQWTDRVHFRRPDPQQRNYEYSPQLAIRPNLERLALAQSARSDSESSRSTGQYLTAPNFTGTPGFHSPWATPPTLQQEYPSSPLAHSSPRLSSLPALRPGPPPLPPGLPHPALHGSPSYAPAAATTQNGPSDQRLPSFRLRICQQPEAARACGFGERDRRVIDPPPILQLEITTPSANQMTSPSPCPATVDVVHASLWNARGTSNVTNLSLPNHRSSRRLMGTLVASSAVALDEHNDEGSFFAFPDLSCRSQGRYRLRFSFMRVDPTSSPAGMTAQVAVHVMSDVFTVYSAKDFPGMKPSTPLTLTLKQQGVAIQAKQGRYGASSKRGRDEDDDVEENEEDDVSTRLATRKHARNERS